MAVVRNLGETAWLPDNVNLRVEGVTPRSQRILRRVDQFEATGESVRLNPGEFSEDDLVTLTMELEGVTRFGQRFEIRRR
jgi:hypothetical protein